MHYNTLPSDGTSDNPFIRAPYEPAPPLAERSFLAFGSLPQVDQLKVEPQSSPMPIREYLVSAAQVADQVAEVNSAEDSKDVGSLIAEQEQFAKSYVTRLRKVHRERGSPATTRYRSKAAGAIEDLAEGYYECNKARIPESVSSGTSQLSLRRHLSSNLKNLLLVHYPSESQSLEGNGSDGLAELPDFSQLDPHLQQDTIELFGKEWQELLRIMSSVGLLRESLKTPEHWPLVSSSVARLRNAFYRYPEFSKATICQLFLDQPRTYRRTLLERRQLEKQEQEERKLLVVTRVLAPGENQQVIQELLLSPHVQSSVATLSPGQTITIGEPGAVLKGEALDRLIYDHLRLFSLMRYGRKTLSDKLHPVTEKDGVLLKAGSLLRRNLEGIVHDITVSRPASNEQRGKFRTRRPGHSKTALMLEAKLVHGQAPQPIRVWLELDIGSIANGHESGSITWSVMADEVTPATEERMQQAARTAGRRLSVSNPLGNLTVRRIIV